MRKRITFEILTIKQIQEGIEELEQTKEVREYKLLKKALLKRKIIEEMVRK